ncbi:Uncharacterised protein [Corynebacterium kutscheri]|uniref:Uncharacterized protein n=2 Tax=Corynebacterium kutscheri TaxID=35755 RepID=A0AB38VYT0_9CORY|nr:Uncharacterised protein [Corynebacterium kutscheri]VEH80093.1 Uncharacterised protein [Corynebacterium kutscheri]
MSTSITNLRNMKKLSHLYVSSHEQSPINIARYIDRHFTRDLDALHSILRHPRSLARNHATWRPPAKKLPKLPGGEELVATITRHRVGAKVQTTMHSFDNSAPAVFLISLRITSPKGNHVSTAISEGWIHALLGSSAVECAHDITTNNTHTYVWITDKNYFPLHSPAMLFNNGIAAA